MSKFYLFLAKSIMNITARIMFHDEDVKDVKDGLLDIISYLEGKGFDSVDSMEFDSGVNRIIAKIARELQDSKIIDKFTPEVQERIVNTALDDISRWVSNNYNKIYLKIIDEIDIDYEIKKYSQSERTLWGFDEEGAYSNCIRFATGIFRKNIVSDSSFTAESLIKLNVNMSDIEKVLVDEIRSIRNILEKSILTPDKYKNYETDYLINLKRKNDKISLFGSGIADRKYKTYSVEPSYVQLFCIRDADSDEQYDNLGLNHLLNRENIIWLNGEAGGGKTTFIQWLAVQAASNLKNADNLIGGLVPIVIKLRDVEFPINYENEINKVTAPIGKYCPNDYFYTLLNADKLLLLIDGLDEVSYDEQKQVYGLVECLYDELVKKAKERQRNSINSKIIITTRPYVEDELEVSHGRYMISRMKMTQIKKFVYFWHKAIFENDFSDEELKMKADSVLSKIKNSHGIRTIAGTPLLCAMICALYYYNNGEVPDKRGELYEQCCRMLLYSRDKERRIEDKRFEYLEYTTVLTIIQDIAMYMLRSGHTEVDKNCLIEHMKAIYKDHTLISNEVDRNNPAKLLDFLIKRTGVIREPSKGRVDFIHKTFLEFLAAEALKNYSSWGEIENKITDEFWKETIIMCFWKTSSDNASRMLENFIDMYEKTNNDEIIFMASMCAQAATNIKISLQRKIEDYLSKLIPPTKQNINKLSHAGEYVLPFLANQIGFSHIEKRNCLDTLANISIEDINIDEYLRVIFTYLEAGEDYEVKKAAWNSICDVPMDVLIENDIERVLFDAFLSNDLKNIRIPSSILGVIRKSDSLLSVNKLSIEIEKFDLYYDEDLLGNDFSVCKKIFRKIHEVELIGVSRANEIEWIDEINGVKSLSITINDDSEAIINYIGDMQIAHNIEKLFYNSYDLNYICNDDISPLIHLKDLTLHLYSPDLEFYLDSFDSTPDLQNVTIDLDSRVVQDIHYSIMDLEEKYPNINITIK